MDAAASRSPGPRIPDTAASLVRGLLAGEPRALARAITAVENATADAPAILAAVDELQPHALVIGITGPPGAGKSTLIDALVRVYRGEGRRVGVLAVDPSSPVSGGAILGDRIRMGRHAEDAGVFVRSVASRGHLGGLSASAWAVMRVMAAAGPDVLLVETVGTGQSEVEIAGLCRLRVVVCAPGLGDEVQAIKAGILEIADLLVVNKADHPQAQRTVQALEAMLALRAPGAVRVPVLRTAADRGEGVEALVDALQAAADAQHDPAGLQAVRTGAALRAMLADAAARRLRQRLAAGADPRLALLCERVRRGELGLDEAAECLLAPLPQA